MFISSLLVSWDGRLFVEKTVKKFTEKLVTRAELLSSLELLNEILFPDAVNVTTETTRRAVVKTELTNGRTGN